MAASGRGGKPWRTVRARLLMRPFRKYGPGSAMRRPEAEIRAHALVEKALAIHIGVHPHDEELYSRGFLTDWRDRLARQIG
ncbi:hypothetical protein [Streptomyces sp. NPDC127092]|uniref:hypothetical protein n=1 Tax=Streptomyces sp. NPDC127092 TaxID=3347135 RepID=UPI00364E93A2